MVAKHKQDGTGRDVTDLLMGGVSAMFATMFTNPIEVVKTRLQLQGELKSRGKHKVFYKNVPHGLFVIARTEGFVALQSGLPAMMGFQFFLNTFRLGVYRITERRGLTTDGTGRTSLIKGAAAAGLGGALGSIAGTPFFLVKTRLQAQAARAIAVGHQHKHAGTFSALREIYGKEGVKANSIIRIARLYRSDATPNSIRSGEPLQVELLKLGSNALNLEPKILSLFRGVYPQIPRGAAGSSSQILSFTFAKERLRERGWFQHSPLALSFVGANLGGLVMTVCLNPFDVVATRLSNQPVDVHNRGTLYSGMADCFLKMVRSEGAASLYKGVGANYLRLGPHTVLLLVCWDQLKILEEYLRR